MVELILGDFTEWLVAYGAAWQDGGARAAVDLFSEHAEYYKSPFDTPLVGR